MGTYSHYKPTVGARETRKGSGSELMRDSGRAQRDLHAVSKTADL